MDHKFKVGDKVRILEETNPAGEFKGLPQGTIVLISGGYDDSWKLQGVSGWVWRNNQIELVVEESVSNELKYEIGKKYKTNGNYVVTCVMFNKKGMPVFEKDDGVVFHKPHNRPFYEEYIEPPKPKTGTVWVNIWSDGFTFIHASKELAEKGVSSKAGRIACVEVAWTEGMGLEDDSNGWV